MTTTKQTAHGIIMKSAPTIRTLVTALALATGTTTFAREEQKAENGKEEDGDDAE